MEEKQGDTKETQLPQTKSEVSTEKIEQRKEKLIFWLKNPYNAVFLGILILGIAIRLYYFWMAKSQPIWWDESDYMAYAKNLAGMGSNWVISSGHNSIFPFVVAGLFKLSLSEEIIRFILGVLPSILLVFLAYKVPLLMYKDKRIALICCFLMATFWSVLFDDLRFHVDVPSLFLSALALYVFWKGYENKEKIFNKINSNWAIPLAVLLTVLAYSVRRAYALFGIIMLVYLFSSRSIKELIKDKYNWIGFFIGIVALFIVEQFIFISGVSSIASRYIQTEYPLTIIQLQVFRAYFESMSNTLFSSLFYLFYLGVILIVINVVLSLGYIKRSKDTRVKADLFNFLTMAVVLFYFIFLLIPPPGSPWGEPRWYYPLLLASFVCISRATVVIADLTKSYHKYIPIAIIVVLIGYGGYYEVQHADFIIKNKLNSYAGIKEAGLFVKSVSNPQDIILVVPEPQAGYYAERATTQPKKLLNTTINENTTLEGFLEKLNSDAPNLRYIIVTFSEPNHPLWMRQDVIQNGQYARWLIPFMNTTIDFTTGTQDIKQEVTYGDITFKLLTIKQDAFVYEIIRK